MARTVSIGAQGFAELREQGYFYTDKTDFIRQWWASGDQVTLVCRPRRFGKTLAMNTVECFLSTRYAGRGEELFGGLCVWGDEQMRALQGSLPVVALSFAGCKGADYGTLRAMMCRALREACEAHGYLLESECAGAGERAFLSRVSDDMNDATAAGSLNQLCAALEAHHGTRPVVLLDEYDTPMQEAWTVGCFDEMAGFVRALFNSTFKTNRALGRALLTGVTRVTSESIFSDLNNLRVVTATSNEYAECFGFTEDEVFSAMDEMGLDDRAGVRRWYDGFTFGQATDIYNPWSVTNYLKERTLAPYWANTSSNGLVSTILRGGDGNLQRDFEKLLDGKTLQGVPVDETVTFKHLGRGGATWGLLLAAGYVRADNVTFDREGLRGMECDLTITNLETAAALRGMVLEWFGAKSGDGDYNEFVAALLKGDLEEAQGYLEDVLVACASSFDGGKGPSDRKTPERFYHGLVLGLLVELRGRYEVASNRESGRGRCDVTLAPLRPGDPALVIEFKLFDRRREATLEDTVERALAQIRERDYAASLLERGVEPGRIRELGFAFSGEEVLIGEA